MARLIEPWIARGVARRVAGVGTLKDSYLIGRLRRDLEMAVPRSEELVAESSGIPSPPPVTWAIIDRAAWAESNITSMAELLRPLADRLGDRLERAPMPFRTAQRAAVSVEVGVLLGYVSKRVLGQYDVLVPEEPTTDRSGRRNRDTAALYFVGPNIVETERRFGFVPEEFALWVALHEVTHRFQFAGVPWLRPRFLSLVGKYLGTVDLDVRGLAKRLASAGSRLMDRSTPAEERNPVYLLASEDQRAVLDDIQALMAVVEGHGNFVMDSIGAQVIPSFGRMRRTFQQRRKQTSAAQRAVNNVLGIEMKLRQYELGQTFCETVAERRGPDALSALWSEEGNLPALAELKDPDRWLSRVG